MNAPDGNDDNALDAKRVFDYRSVVGTTGYCAGAFRPDLVSDACLVLTTFRLSGVQEQQTKSCNMPKRTWLCCPSKRGAEALRTNSDAGGIGKDKKRRTQGGRIYALPD